jgi:hypothetical protein
MTPEMQPMQSPQPVYYQAPIDPMANSTLAQINTRLEKMAAHVATIRACALFFTILMVIFFAVGVLARR